MKPAQRAIGILAFCVALAAPSTFSGATITNAVAWGDNSYGQCLVPQTLSDPVAVAAGADHSMALTRAGSVVVWGRNAYGLLNPPSGGVAIAGAEFRGMVLRSDGTVAAWGDNLYGANNVPSWVSNAVAIAGGAAFSLALFADGSVGSWGGGIEPSGRIVASGIRAISAGREHALAISTGDALVCWGRAFEGQLAVPAGLSDVTAVAGGAWHSLALRTDGRVFAWGTNYAPGDGVYTGQALVPSDLNSVVAIAAGYYHNLALHQGGTVTAWGDNRRGQCTVPTGLTNVIGIAAGGSHSLALVAVTSPMILESSAPQIVLEGGEASFDVVVTGTTPFGFCWRREGTLLTNSAAVTGEASASLTVQNLVTSDSGVYSVTVSNAAGAATTEAALTVTNFIALADGKVVEPLSQILTGAVTVVLQTSFANGSIMYTLDGSDPAISPTIYSGPFVVSRSGTIRAIAYNSDFSQSVTATPTTLNILPAYPLVATMTGGGALVIAPPVGPYLSNSLVSVTATPAEGWTFLQWLGDTQGATPTAVLTMNRAKHVRAVFGTPLVTQAVGSGTISLVPSSELHPFGSRVRLTTTPLTGNGFAFWANGASGSNSPLDLVVTTPNPTFVAVFTALTANQRALNLEVDGFGIINRSASGNRFPSGEAIQLTAIPEPGQDFLSWSGDASGKQNPLFVTMDRSKVITAHFTKRPTVSATRGLDGFSEEGFRFTITGEFGAAYRIDGTMNLADWTTLGWLTNRFGVEQFTDGTASNQTWRFYRAAGQAAP